MACALPIQEHVRLPLRLSHLWQDTGPYRMLFVHGTFRPIFMLKDAPPWLVLRVNRFRQDASGGVCKIRTAMGWTPELRFPAFCDDALSVVEVRYQLRACIVHLGEHIVTGHYSALLVRDADRGEGNEFRYCDDGIKAVPISDFGTIATDVYMLFFVRETPSSQ